LGILRDSFGTNAILHSSIGHLIRAFEGDIPDTPLCQCLFERWRRRITQGNEHDPSTPRVPGIQAVVLVPSLSEASKLGKCTQIDLGLRSGLRNRIKAAFRRASTGEIGPLIVFPAPDPAAVSDILAQVEWRVVALRHRLKVQCEATSPVHTLIVLNLEQAAKRTKLTQSLEWPVLYMDASTDAPVLPLNGRDLRLTIEEIAFTAPITLIRQDILDVRALVQSAVGVARVFYESRAQNILDIAVATPAFFDLIVMFITSMFENVLSFQLEPGHTLPGWVHDQLRARPAAPTSILDFLELRLLEIVAAYLSVIFRTTLAGFAANPNEHLRSHDITAATSLLQFPSVAEALAWAAEQTSPQFLPIETRFASPVFGIYAAFCLLWPALPFVELANFPRALDEASFSLFPRQVSAVKKERKYFLTAGLRSRSPRTSNRSPPSS
jgi:hypothetical protein